MKILISSDNMDLNISYKQYITDKLGKQLDAYLTNFPEDVKTARVTVNEAPRHGYTANFELTLPKKEHIYAEASHDDAKLVITAVRDKAEQQIKKHMGKISNSDL